MSRWLIIILLINWRLGLAIGQTVTNLYVFTGVDGNSPVGVIQGTDGSFYGTTYYGGASTNCSQGCGTIFKVSASGSFTNLYFFSSGDGAVPNSSLVQGSDGSFYGTTAFGGTNLCNCGTVFRITPGGSLTMLYTFGGSPNDGAQPYAGLVQGSDGNFYGTTRIGGPDNVGTVFRISPSGIKTNLYFFGGLPDGRQPHAALVQASDGNFYGTTSQGGPLNRGTVFRISPGGSYTNLYSFGIESGQDPVFALTQGTDGNLYGTAQQGGTNNAGSVFRISPSGSFTNLYTFTDPWRPNSVLVQGSDGNFYGTTTYGGNGCASGALFWISPSGSNFNSYCAGLGPVPDGVVQGIDGNLYGTTYEGGGGPCNSGCGTIFEISLFLNPPANQISAAQITDSDVVLSIPSVAGETYQLQFRTDLTAGMWSNVDGAVVTNSIGALLTLTNFGGALSPQGFYRFSITP